MFKKLLKIVGAFVLAILVFNAGAIAWYNMSGSKKIEVAKHYVEENIETVVTWDLEQFQSLLTPTALESLQTEKGRKALKIFSKLGKLKSIEEPKLEKGEFRLGTSNSSYDIITFSTLGHFQADDALITITLSKVKNSYSIHSFKVSSDAFFE